MISFRPLGNTVIVEMSAEKEKTSGGIYLPQIETKMSKPVTGKVVAVGVGKALPDGKRLDMTVKAGDRVLFGKFAGSELSGKEVGLEDKDYYIMSEEDIMAVLEEA